MCDIINEKNKEVKDSGRGWAHGGGSQSYEGRSALLLSSFEQHDNLSQDPKGSPLRGSIDEYRPGRWRAYLYRHGKRFDFYKYTDGTALVHPKLAERLRKYINYLIDHHRFDPSALQKDKPFTFEKAVEIWNNRAMCSPEWRAKSGSIARSIIIPFFKGRDIREIRRIHIEEFLSYLQKCKFSEKYIFNILGVFKSVMNFHEESIPKMPTFPTVSSQEAPIRWLTAKQQDEIFEFIGELDRPIFTFMRWTGCRPNEAAGLLSENIFLKSDPPYLVLATVLGRYGLKPNTKTRKLKPLPIIPEIEWTLKPKEVTKYIFTKHGNRYTSRMLQHAWKRANKKASEKYGTPQINLYNGLKHSFGCQRINAGVSLDAIRAVMGHTDSRTTEMYAKYAVEELAPAMRGR